MIHQRKAAKLPLLKQAMREMLAASAASLTALPADDQIVVAVTLFYFSWEDRTGLPSQILMQASKKSSGRQARERCADALPSVCRNSDHAPGRNAHRAPADRAGGPGEGARNPAGARREDRQDPGRPGLRRHARRAGGALRAACRCRWSTHRRPAAGGARDSRACSPRFMRQCRFLPVAMEDSTLTIAMADPLDFETLAAVRGFTGLKVQPVLAAEQEILDAIDKYYGEEEKAPAERARDGGRSQRGPRAPARHGQRGAGHPPGQRHDRPGGREARQRHPHRAVREGVPRPLPRGRRAATTRSRRRAS